jgi:hypothetical protein
MRGMYIVAFVQLSLQIWQADHHGQILPDIAVAELQSLAHIIRCTELRSRDLATLGS